MPRYTIITEIKNKTYYMHFSGIVDAPLTPFLEFEDFKEYYLSEYTKDDWNDFLDGRRNMMTLDDAVLCNNLNKQEILTKEQFLEKYLKKGDEEDVTNI